MLVVIDESGDSGFKFERGSSPFFVITAIILSDDFGANACDRSIEELRRKLRLPRDHEFHFKDCRDSIKRRFLSHVAADPFRYHAFVIDKQMLFGERFRNPTEFYSFAAGIVCENARPVLNDAKVIIDKNGDRNFKQRLEKSLKQRMTESDGTCRIRKVTMEHSHSNNLVQLADMVCGAVARRFCGKAKASEEFTGLIRNRQDRIQIWPKK